MVKEEKDVKGPGYHAGYRNGLDDAGAGGVNVAGLVIVLSVVLFLAGVFILVVKAPIS